MDILVVDDHPSIVEGLRAVLTSEFQVSRFESAATSQAALSLATSRPWTLIISDLSLPGRDGPELISEFARLVPDARILVYTVHSERQFGVRALRAGAHGYVRKDQPLECLLAAIRRLLAGKRFLSDELAEDLVDAISRGGRDATELLSDRELQVLRLIGRGWSGKEIADHLHISGKTVTTYRSRLLEKLRLSSTADLIRYAVDHKIAE